MVRDRKKQLSLSRIRNGEVAAVFRSYPKAARSMLRQLRALIVDTASSLEEVGALEETLKWGEPSYLASQPNVGSTVRIDWKPADPHNVAIYFKCTANLVPLFRKRYAKQLQFGGDRSIVLSIESKLPTKELRYCIALALTYHLNKKLSPNKRWKFVEERLSS